MQTQKQPLKFLDRKDLKQLAQQVAFTYNAENDSNPPDWVVEAMNEAYRRGLEDCTRFYKKD